MTNPFVWTRIFINDIHVDIWPQRDLVAASRCLVRHRAVLDVGSIGNMDEEALSFLERCGLNAFVKSLGEKTHHLLQRNEGAARMQF